MCHRCYSAMGGCSDHVVWRMYPWRECGNEFCVKVIEKVPGKCWCGKFVSYCGSVLPHLGW